MHRFFRKSPCRSLHACLPCLISTHTYIQNTYTSTYIHTYIDPYPASSMSGRGSFQRSAGGLAGKGGESHREMTPALSSAVHGFSSRRRSPPPRSLSIGHGIMLACCRGSALFWILEDNFGHFSVECGEQTSIDSTHTARITLAQGPLGICCKIPVPPSSKRVGADLGGLHFGERIVSNFPEFPTALC